MTDLYGLDSQNLVKDALTTEMETLHQGILDLVGSNTVSESQLQLLRGLVSLSQFAVQQAAQEQYLSVEVVNQMTALQQEIEFLRSIQMVHEQHVQWLKDQSALARNTIGQLRLKAILNQTLELAISISYAETGSIFLLGDGNVIVDCILMRQQTTDEERRDLVGRVLQKGLAGWVAHNLTAGLVQDVRTDKRWVNFPDQPYQVGSALCIPMLLGQKLVGIFTLTHPDFNHFTEEDSELLSTVGYEAALVLDHDRLNNSNKKMREQLQLFENQFRQLLQTPLVGVFLIQNQKFIQVNAKLAALLGYTREELLRLPSISSVIAYEDRTEVVEALNRCTTGNLPQLKLTFGISCKNGRVRKVMAQGIMMKFQGRSSVMGMMDEIYGS